MRRNVRSGPRETVPEGTVELGCCPKRYQEYYGSSISLLDMRVVRVKNLAAGNPDPAVGALRERMRELYLLIAAGYAQRRISSPAAASISARISKSDLRTSRRKSAVIAAVS